MLLNFLIGYDILEVDGARCADFVNACATLCIDYHALGGTRFRMSLRGSLRIREFCKNAKIPVRLCERRGVPSLALCFLRRPGLVLGLALCAVMLAFSSNAIWSVRVEGNKSVPNEKIIETLRQCGVSVGTDKRTLDIDSVQNRFLIISDEISWISVNIVGNIAEVEVRETAPEEQRTDYICSNLVATQNGQIVEFCEVRGNIAVELGEAVSRGQLLVGGVYGDENSALRFVRSRGQVMALCQREYEIDVERDFDKKVYSGEKKSKKTLIFFEKEVKLFVNSGNLYASCDIIEEEKYLNFFGLGDLPIGVRTYEYVEYTTEVAQRTEEQMREQANFLLWQKFFADSPSASVAGTHAEGTLTDTGYRLSAKIKSIENIAQEKQVEINLLE